jgi:hypothetical protein
VDPLHFLVSLQPDGLVFDPANPAQLRIWYAEANPDFNGDGVVDHKDDEILDKGLGLWRLPREDELWHRIGAVQFHDAKRFEAELYGFSHYAVAH